MNHIFLIGLFLLIGIGAYIAIRLQLKWPTKNNPLFFSIVLAPPLLVGLSPLAQTEIGMIIYSLAAGLFLTDAFYHKHQQNKIYKQENDERKKQKILEKEREKQMKKRSK